MIFEFTGKIWLYSGKGAWYFITLPEDISKEIHHYFSSHQKPFGTLPVEVKIGKTSWNTSIFWDTKQNSFLLPLKSEIRKAEKLQAERVVDITLNIPI